MNKSKTHKTLLFHIGSFNLNEKTLFKLNYYITEVEMMGNIALSEQIKKLRSSKRITLAVMAERIGVTTSAVAAYENGSRNPSFDVLMKIARLFNVTVDNLLGYTNKDLMDVSDLTVSQRDNIQNLVLTYKKFNKLVVSAFDIDEDINQKIECYHNTSFEKFQELIDKNKGRI